jgi:hypothetical protein
MTFESAYLLKIAQRNAATIARDPNVAAVLVMGSVARGDADRFSDIDTAVYYHEPPTEADFTRIRDVAVATGGGLHGGSHERGFAVYAYADGGVRCDFAHASLGQWERDVAAVLERFEADSPMQKVLGGVLEGTPLYGDAVIMDLKAKAAYPEGLRTAMVEKHLGFWPTELMRRMIADRGDLLWLNEVLVEAQKNVLGMLMGLNRLYHWGEYKRLDALASGLPIAPERFADRLRAAQRAAPEAAIDAIGEIADETLTLVERHLPAVEVATARNRLHRPLAPWEVVDQP